MEFNVVIGNPPYNDGMDIDFVFYAFEISKDQVQMITPAKWQTADANQAIQQRHTYGQFRQKLVPHMKQVCFYPDCKDIFNIMQQDGITYYILDKHKTFDRCTVVNKCKTIAEFNSSESRSILNRETLINAGNKINEYLKQTDKFKFQIDGAYHRYIVGTNSQLPGGGLYAITKSNPKVYYLGESKVIDASNPNWMEGTSSQLRVTFRSDSKEECESFCSYLNSRFVRFFIALNISKMSPVTSDEYFRFVPAPAVLNSEGDRVAGKFDHIYTDQELYKTFNLPQEYIDIIEAVVKERRL